MSMTYGHAPTETIIASLQQTERDSGLSVDSLLPIAKYFENVRKKYAKFEGSLKGIDARIIEAQVPGGMLTNMENQLKDQGAEDKFDAVLQEIPKVRQDLGYIPLVTPSSQIVGTQSVLNVLSKERYKVISKETENILRGHYGLTPAPLNQELQQKVLKGDKAITERPANLIKAEFEQQKQTLVKTAASENITLAKGAQLDDDTLTYTLFPQVGLQFLKNRNNPDAFEPLPKVEQPIEKSGSYNVTFDGKTYVVTVNSEGDIQQVNQNMSAAATPSQAVNEPVNQASLQSVPAPLAGNVLKILVKIGDQVQKDQPILIVEAMKMETEVVTPIAGQINSIAVKIGDKIAVGDVMLNIS